jgi:hypothetical protein
MKTLLSLTVCSLLLAPAMAFAVPPATVKTQPPATAAQPNAAYRSYSYQTTTSGPYRYQRASRELMFFSGHQRAGYKVNGEYWAR